MDEPRWLTDEEQQAWRRLLEVLIKVPAALEGQLQREAGLTHMGYLVLAQLSERDDHRMSMSRLAKKASASLSRLSHVVARLEAQGLVRRERDPEDGRVQIAALTDAGLAKIVAVAPGHVETVRNLIFDRLTTTQLRQLHKLCDVLLEAPASAQ